MNKEKIEHHIKHLEQLHKRTEVELQKEQNFHNNEPKVTELKKNKLKLKDEIEKLKKQIA